MTGTTTETNSPEYDVAISFLVNDVEIASAIDQELVRSLAVFFYPRKQEELAGTDGMESMRQPFLHSRVMVVLYREPWGKTRWTAIEETAIKEACFDGKWNHLMFVVLDKRNPLPKWLPEHHVRFNWEDFGLAQLVGAIKARAIENGCELSVLTAAKRAAQLKADNDYRAAQAKMKSEGDGINEVQALFREIEKQCSEVNSQYNGQVECRSALDPANEFQTCVLTDRGVAISIVWYQPARNSLTNSRLIIRQFDHGLTLPGEDVNRMYMHSRPSPIAEVEYQPELSRARERGWNSDNEPFLATASLAERIVMEFLELKECRASGKLPRPDRW